MIKKKREFARQSRESSRIINIFSYSRLFASIRGQIFSLHFSNQINLLKRIGLISYSFPILILLFSISCNAWAGVALPIAVDGSYEDWDSASPAYTDTLGDNGTSPIDFGRLFIANDQEHLFLRFEIGTEIIVNAGNSISLYIDWDGNPDTGQKVEGIGADIKWVFGSRSGKFYGTSTQDLAWIDLDLRRAPTVSSNQFEISLSRTPDIPITGAGTISILFRNETGGIQDKMPNTGAISYTFSSDPVPAPPVIPLAKIKPSDLRILTYNTSSDGLFSRTQNFSRILKALKPDILNFQEVNGHTGLETRDLINGILPLPAGEAWSYADNTDCVTVSRFPVTNQWTIDANLGVLISAPAGFGATSLLVINAHTPCCQNETDRQAECDNIMSFIRDAKTEGGIITVPQGTPMFIVGDLNLVGWAQQLKTLLQGDIVDQATYGADFNPDWDNTPLADFIPYHTATREAYTWRSESGSYDPGWLDYIIYTDSALQLARHFALWTPDMAPADLSAYSLQSNDSPTASDHLPLTADVRPQSRWNLWLLY